MASRDEGAWRRFVDAAVACRTALTGEELNWIVGTAIGGSGLGYRAALAVTQALGVLAGHDESTAALCMIGIDCLAAHDSAEVRAAALEVALDLDPPEARRLAERAATDAHEMVRQVASAILATG